jgi:hypothetical protein
MRLILKKRKMRVKKLTVKKLEARVAPYCGGADMWMPAMIGFVIM